MTAARCWEQRCDVCGERRKGELQTELFGFACIGRFLAASPGNGWDLGHEIKMLVRFIVLEVRSDTIQDAFFHIDQHGQSGKRIVESLASLG